MTEHTDRCKVHKAKFDAWVAKWPDYCRECNATGEFQWQENQAPLGSGCVWLEDLSEPCECWTSVENPRCPRCGATGDQLEYYEDEEEMTCNFCGWNSEKARDVEPDMVCSEWQCTCGIPDDYDEESVK